MMTLTLILYTVGMALNIVQIVLVGTKTLTRAEKCNHGHPVKGDALALEIEPYFAEEARKRQAQATGQPRGVKQSVVANVPQQKSRDQAAAAVGRGRY